MYAIIGKKQIRLTIRPLYLIGFLVGGFIVILVTKKIHKRNKKEDPIWQMKNCI